MNVDVINTQKAIRLSFPKVRSLVQAIIEHEGIQCDEVALHFVNTKAICDLHERFFGDPSPTDCISFPMGEEEGLYMLGDVFVCPETALEYSKRHKTDPYEEVALYIVHGLLHLMGYDDISKEDRAVMRAKEKRLLAMLKKQNLSLVGRKMT